MSVADIASELFDARAEYFIEDAGDVVELVAPTRDTIVGNGPRGDSLATLQVCAPDDPDA